MLLHILFLFALNAFSASAVCLHSKLHHRAAGVSVEILDAGGANVKAVVTNTGNEAVRLFSGGTVLDDSPVKKVIVYHSGTMGKFIGIIAAHATSGLTDDSFVDLLPGQSAENTFDISATWDIEGGDYTVQSIDGIPFAVANSTKLIGVFEYESNILEMTISPSDVTKRALAPPLIRPRTLIQCDNQQHKAILQTALDRAVEMASNGANAALGGNSSTFHEFYQTISPSTRSNVAARFRAIASEASLQANERLSTYFCEDQSNFCKNGVIAYTQPSQNYIANCPIFYTMTLWPRYCDDQTQASVVVHEMTHAPGIFSPGTADHAYGPSSSMGLSETQALSNADTYALYATRVTMNC